MATNKKCCKCGILKSLEDFCFLSASKDGRNYFCRVCHSIKNKKDIGVNPNIYLSHRRSVKKRYRENQQFRVRTLLGNRIRSALKGGRARKAAATFSLIGCPQVWLEVHLESLFTSEMNWENYGPVWHIDHIKPCAAFDLTDPEQQRICFHWTNLQPLLAKDNIRKSDLFCGHSIN